ncbi:hypothetical protein KOR34_04760 [Posidoniimonas corsicana]|uniref:Uncharacterized protein n=1 Tax=Posidoniimonas corsicana TaxID=1938618 RepID=A0A5C5VC96_9BACT|nr:hypothetical protein [Posidoniimonas corsicana]TWT35583.1 hypothetical protein KOR34_04760 [Posidoniimonas corsicana]
MPSVERKTKKRKGDDGTRIEITTVRTCQKIGPKTICTPRINEAAQIHLGAAPARRLNDGQKKAAAAIATYLASTGAGTPAAAIVALVGALIAIGYDALKNTDGSMDIYLTNVSASAGKPRVPVVVDPGVCTVFLQTL